MKGICTEELLQPRVFPTLWGCSLDKLGYRTVSLSNPSPHCGGVPSRFHLAPVCFPHTVGVFLLIIKNPFWVFPTLWGCSRHGPVHHQNRRVFPTLWGCTTCPRCAHTRSPVPTLWGCSIFCPALGHIDRFSPPCGGVPGHTASPRRLTAFSPPCGGVPVPSLQALTRATFSPRCGGVPHCEVLNEALCKFSPHCGGVPVSCF